MHINWNILIIKIIVAISTLAILVIWVGIEKLLERRDLKELERELKRRL